MLLAVKAWPFGSSTRAAFARLRAANGMSAVMTMSPAAACSAIQSSAAPKPGQTTISTGPPGTRIGAFATTFTGTAYRVATRYTSSFTGQASASMKMVGVPIPPV
jgi:hypothetical protein